MKTCRKCRASKPLAEFYRHSAMAVGHLNQCKACKRAYQRRHSKTDAGRANARRRAQKPARRAYQAETSKKWRSRNPAAYRANTMVNNAVRDGRLHKPNRCERCDARGQLHGHHDDYSKPLEVRWLCPYCHGDEHPETQHQISVFAVGG